MKSYLINAHPRDPEISYMVVKTLRWKAESIDNLRKRLAAEWRNETLSFVIYEIPADKDTNPLLATIGKNYRGTYNIKTIDGKKVPTWNVDQGDGWNYKRNVINKDGSLGRRLRIWSTREMCPGRSVSCFSLRPHPGACPIPAPSRMGGITSRSSLSMSRTARSSAPSSTIRTAPPYRPRSTPGMLVAAHGSTPRAPGSPPPATASTRAITG